MKIKLSCTDNMVPGKTLTEKAHKLRELGYDGMAIFCDYPDWKDELLEEMLQLKAKTGIQPCEFVFTGPIYGHLMDKDPKIQRDTIELYKRSIAVANQLGAITEMEYEYRTQDPLPLFDPYQTMPEDEQKVFVDIINELGATVRDGAYMLLESCNRYETRYLTRLGDCAAMLEKADPNCTKNMGLICDFFHVSIEEDNIEQAILDSGKWIRHVHLGDSNRLAPGYGHTDWKSAFKALNRIGFTGYMNLECGLPGDRETTLAATAKYLRGVAEEIA